MFEITRVVAFCAALGLAVASVGAQNAVDDLEPTDDPALVPPTEELVTVAVVAFQDHPANEGCIEGLRVGLEQYGYTHGDTVELETYSADGEAERLKEIVEHLAENRPTVVTPIGTVAAQGVSALRETPVVFCAVPDPVSAGLVESMMHPGGNITGVSDAVPLSQQLALIREVLPTVMQLGVIYDPDDRSSVRLVERLTDFLPGAGFQLTEVTVSSAEEVEEAVRGLVEQAHVLYILSDPTVLAGLEDAIRVAEESDTPLFVADAQLVERGAVGSRAFDYLAIGKQTADVMARVLDGENPSDIPVGQAELTTLVINVTAAERMGLQLAPGFVARADQIIE